MAIQQVLEQLSAGQDLSCLDSENVFDALFLGAIPPEQIKQLLLSLHNKGETVEEILGAARSMRKHMKPISAPANAMDIVGTGGDQHGTFNISTAVAFVVAACGVPVAKHGNRASTSRSGSSDVLQALGINIEPEWAVLEQALNELGIVFLFAPRHHPAMAQVAAIRRELKCRTIFNLLGPLTNPAQVKKHLIGVFDLEWLGPMAEVLRALGSDRAWLVNSEDGMDEITTTAATDIVELNNQQLHHFSLKPEDLGLTRADLAQIKGGDAAENAEAIRTLLGAKTGAFYDIVTMNAAAALLIAGKNDNLTNCLHLARDAINSGRVLQKLDDLINLTNR